MSKQRVDAVIAVLTKHNDWRRGADIPMVNVTELGEAIDYAIEVLKIVATNCQSGAEKSECKCVN